MLMAGEKGNLGDVRAALGRNFEIGDVVDASPSNPTFAELIPEASPRWHIIETHPNQERTAAAHLVARRFGMFVPEIEEDIVRRGRKVHRTRLMFTGYIFVFVWDVMLHLSRIEAVPGVRRVMLTRTEIRPAIFKDGVEKCPAVFEDRPAVVSDKVIDQIRAVENKQRPLVAVMPDGAIRTKKKRRWRKWLEQIEQPTDGDIVSVRPWSAFQDGLLSIDASTRNQTLLKALSLSS